MGPTSVPSEAGTQELATYHSATSGSSILSPSASQKACVSNVVTSEAGTPLLGRH